MRIQDVHAPYEVFPVYQAVSLEVELHGENVEVAESSCAGVLPWASVAETLNCEHLSAESGVENVV